MALAQEEDLECYAKESAERRRAENENTVVSVKGETELFIALNDSLH